MQIQSDAESHSVMPAAALISAFFYLAVHKRYLEDLQKEITSIVQSGKFDMRKAYSVLDSVINEALRMQPVVPSGGQRKTPELGLQIGDIWIPGGISVTVPVYTMFRGIPMIKQSPGAS
jgi:cytochrome P450 family 628